MTLTPTHTGVLDALANYVLGPGFTFTARINGTGPVTQEAAGIAATAQATIDRFVDDNHFSRRARSRGPCPQPRDGQAFLVLAPQAGGCVQVRVLECEQLTQPADPRPLEDWLGCGEEFPSCWKFGVHSPLRETDRALGYHVIYDGTGLDWDYVPVASMEHFKRNVPANAKRGVSDFFPVLGDLEREAKLRRNTAEGAALQAANVRQRDGQLDANTEQAPQDLAALLLEAMGEPDFDVSGLPNLPRPEVDWVSAPP